jgi:outer membrane protein
MKRIVFVSLFLLSVTHINAQVLTLEEAINIALKNSLDIEIARNNFEASQISNHLSIAGGVPEVTGSITDNQSLTNLNQQLSNGTTTKRSGNANNALNAGVDASYLLFNGLRVRATKARLEALERQSSQQVNLQIQNLIASVMVKYYDIVRQASYIKTIQQSIDVTLQRKKLVDARQSVGLANNADTYQAQLDLTASRQELRSQELILIQAKADLMNLLTQRPDSTFEIKDTIVVDRSLNIDAVRSELKNNPEFLTAEQQVRINELIVKEVGAQRYPSVSVNGGYNYSRSQNAAGFTLLNQNSGPFIGLGLQIPIFNGGIFKRQKRVAEIDIKNAVNTRESLLNDLETFVVKAWQAYGNNLERLETEQENSRVAADLLALVQQRFEYGVGTIVDVREAQRSFVEAGFRLVNLSYAAKIAEVELKRLASKLGT